MKVLVIGGAGYIGTAITRELWECGHDVTVLDLLLFGGESLAGLLSKPRFQLIRGDIRDKSVVADAMRDQDAVCLLAAIVGEPACNRDPDAAVATNLHGTRNVLQAAKAAGVSRFVFASTCSNYGVTDDDGYVAEDAPLKPLSTYSDTKVKSEQMILDATDENFHPTVLRFSTAFGISARMRFDLLVSDFTLTAVRDGKVVIYGEQFWRPFVHVQDIAELAHRVLQAEPETISGEVFNVGSNESNTQKIELGRRVQQHVIGTELEFVKRDTDLRSYRVDFSKVRDRLGFQTRWTVDNGIAELHEALKAGLWPDPMEKRFYN